MTIIEITYRLPYGWTCDTVFELCEGVRAFPDNALPKRAWRMRRAVSLIASGTTVLWELCNNLGPPSQACKTLRRLIDRGMIRAEKP